jgi:hypothetical protein
MGIILHCHPFQPHEELKGKFDKKLVEGKKEKSLLDRTP